MIRSIILYCIMTIFIVCHDEMALTRGGDVMQHLVYPLSHANLLHWGLNGMSLLFLTRYLRWTRTLWAYAFSVLCGYIYVPGLPLLGFSTIIYYYLGMLFVHYGRWNRFHLLVVSCSGLFIPGIAATTHIIMLAFGIISEYLRLNWLRSELR